LEQKMRERFCDNYAIKDTKDLKHHHGHVSEVFPQAVSVDPNSLDSHPGVTSSGLSEEASLVYMAQKKPASIRRGHDAVSAATESCESSVGLELEADFATKCQRYVGTLWLRHCLLEVLDPALSLAMLVVADAVEVEVDVQGVEWSRV
jgi:hypothetical protein